MIPIQLVKKIGCTILENEAQLFCRMKIGVPKTDEELCIQKLTELYGLEVKQLN